MNSLEVNVKNWKSLIKPAKLDDELSIYTFLIKKSKIQEKYPDFDFDSCAVGIWSQVEQLTSILKDGDRVEIYRDLEDDPKEKRRRLALSGKSMSLKK